MAENATVRLCKYDLVGLHTECVPHKKSSITVMYRMQF